MSEINNERSYTEYIVTTSTTDFPVGFDDFSNSANQDNVLVTLDGIDVSTIGYTVQRKSDLVIKVTPAITTGTVRLQRETNIDLPFHQFTAGALFSAGTMDDNFAQIRHSQQEVRDGFLYVQESALGAAGRANRAAGLAEVATADTITATGNTGVATATALTAAGAANTAKTNADAATGRANTATSNANAARDNANTAATRADTATGKANTATLNANNAASDARAATVTTGVATGNANTAASAANAAADRVATVEAGKAAEIVSVSASTVSPSTPASVVLGGTAQARTFAFKLPKGESGVNATIVSATASTGAAGTAAAVTLGGTPTARTFAFTIPKGDTGAIALSNVQGTSTSTGISQKGFTDYVSLPANAASRKVGTATGNLVERGSDGYPTNNNAVGVGQTWQDVKSDRTHSVNYTNTTGRTIVVYLYLTNTSTTVYDAVLVDGVSVGFASSVAGTPNTFIVPPNSVYRVNTARTVMTWAELR